MGICNIFDSQHTPAEKRQWAREWLRAYQREKLPSLREEKLGKSRYYNDLTLIAYTFPQNETDFDFIEFSIRQSWHCLGLLKAVIIADRTTDTLKHFSANYPNKIDIQIEPTITPGSITSMSHDCVTKLHTRFSTPYCLVIQDDGFPIRDNLDDFIGKYDFIGAPVIRDVPAQYLVDLFRIECLNGGFSLRSRKICKDAANQWLFWRHFIKPGDLGHVEDIFYCKTACLNPFYRFRNKFASCKIARKFCLPDFDGVIDIRNHQPRPFGVHGPTAAWQLLGQ